MASNALLLLLYLSSALLPLGAVGGLFLTLGTPSLEAPPSWPLWGAALTLAPSIALIGLIAARERDGRHLVNLLSTGWAALFAALLLAFAYSAGPDAYFGTMNRALQIVASIWVASALPGTVLVVAIWLRRKSVYNRIQH